MHVEFLRWQAYKTRLLKIQYDQIGKVWHKYIYQGLPTGHHLRLLSLQKPPEETCWKVLVSTIYNIEDTISAGLV